MKSLVRKMLEDFSLQEERKIREAVKSAFSRINLEIADDRNSVGVDFDDSVYVYLDMDAKLTPKDFMRLYETGLADEYLISAKSLNVQITFNIHPDVLKAILQ